MAAGLLGIGSSGLLAFQRSLDTVGHNIANVSTEGYSRQSVDLATRLPQANGFGFMGTGVQTVTVERAFVQVYRQARSLKSSILWRLDWIMRWPIKMQA